MIDRLQQSPFLCPESVTVWDSQFRWREHGRLRDVSIESTWQRVARAASATETKEAARWKSRFFDAQARWQLLFDERILAAAGTGDGESPGEPVAVLNAAAFVVSPLTPAVSFDFETLRATAALAVRGLDNVMRRGLENGTVQPDLRVGLIGVADALALLGKRYDGAAGRVMAGVIAQVLAEGCAQASASLAAERGALCGRRLPACMTGFPPQLRAILERTGTRHRKLTEISSQPALARLANNVANALDPIESEAGTWTAYGGGSPSYAVALTRVLAGPDTAVTLSAALPKVTLSAQIELRGAVQPWIDAPIDYPLRVTDPASNQATAFLHRLADAHKLGTTTLGVS
jgi:Ribonucleotide reductase, barrel domain